MTGDKGAFLVGHIDKQLVCGHVIIPNAERAFWTTLASTETHSEVPKSYPLIYEALRISQSQRFRWYDIVGAPTRAAITDGTAAGGAQDRHQFKIGFTPVHVPLVPAMVLPVRQPAHSILFGLRQKMRGIRAR